MIIFNTTFHIDDSINEEAIAYLKNDYIPNAIRTGRLRNPQLLLIHAQHEESGKSYSLQFKVDNLTLLESWMEEESAVLNERLTSLFGNKVCGFITLLEEIDL